MLKSVGLFFLQLWFKAKTIVTCHHLLPPSFYFLKELKTTFHITGHFNSNKKFSHGDTGVMVTEFPRLCQPRAGLPSEMQ